MINLNITALTALCRFFLPDYAHRKIGRVGRAHFFAKNNDENCTINAEKNVEVSDSKDAGSQVNMQGVFWSTNLSNFTGKMVKKKYF